jgi:hypothetical protein
VFEDRYGWIVTYEDARLEHDSQIVDVTDRIAKTTPTRRLLVPLGGAFAVRHPIPLPEDSPVEVLAILRGLVDAYSRAGLPGDFAVQQTGETFHVVPVAILGRAGKVQSQTSVLNAFVSLSAVKKRNMSEAIEAFCRSVSAAAGYPITVGTVPTNLLLTTPADQAFDKQPARELLLRLFALTESDLSWRLYYDIAVKRYVLNIRIVNAGQTSRW